MKIKRIDNGLTLILRGDPGLSREAARDREMSGISSKKW